MELVAPCGMNCAVCGAYLALTHDVKGKGVRMPYCEGCRTRDKKCAFLKKRCGRLLENRVSFCYECEDFPCKRLKRIDDRYRTFFHTSLIENLELIKNNGISAFLAAQQKKWKCPTCGGTLCCHNGLCFTCELERLKNKKKKYRWED